MGMLGRRSGGSWVWATTACVLLVASGSTRLIQERQHQGERGGTQDCPIDLAKIPTKLGAWHLVDGSDQKLPDLTMRITGGTDHLIRSYANDLTGVSVMVLILYGPAEPVMPHVPAICYPASGYNEGDAPLDRSIAYEIGVGKQGKPIEGDARFRVASYWKPSGRAIHREAVYHAFRLGDQWSPEVGLTRAVLRRNPGIFKIQVQRQVTESESLSKGDPIELFLASLLTEMERELKTNQERSGLQVRSS